VRNLEAHDVLFIDEISPANPIVEKYCILDDGRSAGYPVPRAFSDQIGLNPFTLIGATTRAGLLTSLPSLGAFGIKFPG